MHFSQEDDRTKILNSSILKYYDDADADKIEESLVSKYHDDVELEESDEDEEELYDPVCAICDNGGNILCCEGRCMRSFHATKSAGADSHCESLGFSSDAEVDALPNFMCENCLNKRHQCFICGLLGSSDNSSGAEVFPCVSATCGHFYHPACIAKALHPDDEAQAKQLITEIVAGEMFLCPAHKCCVCKKGENKVVHELQFAMCRRCPKAYHRKCLPRRITFEYTSELNLLQRAWDYLLPNRILIYCMSHKIIHTLATPERDHIIFSDAELQRKREAVEKKRTMMISGNSLKGKTTKLYITSKNGFTKNVEKRLSGQGFDSLKKPRITNYLTHIPAHKSFTSDANKSSLRNDESRSLLFKGPCPVKPKVQYLASSKLENTKSVKPMSVQGSSSLSSVDPEMENRIVALIKKAKSSLSLEDVTKKMKVPSTHAYISKNVLDKTITEGKVEGSVKAIKTALHMLNQGRSIEDAKAVCSPEIVKQIFIWKKKLAVYLAPFRHGTRYTSFGRHFTKVEKLKEIVERLQWYVRDGDMIVDFCCGANDFSSLMKEKIDQMGKSCSFKNYDLFQPKNDFSFEGRDWMTVHPDELPDGSRLIMGLNPPFGVHASLANKFIDKALEFRPKLLILVVPQETNRLDVKRAPYDLIWEDDKLLSGKSFYLPGSVDVNNDQMEQWNLDPPPLYLWSRPDWTHWHKKLAQDHGHFFKEVKKERRFQDEASLYQQNQDSESIGYVGAFYKRRKDSGPSQ